ncbi:hypothetical protein [Actinocorallia aurantiaca]|uniref:Uncharacterized protein n=1 Tax=Actinocorallia aurantiaca TaxID=46204 RepID=A0ABP6GWZ8_9ACTN
MLLEDERAHECAIRNAYADRLSSLRRDERLIGVEPTFEGTSLRADMKTVDSSNTLRIWEFKIWADHRSLGQVLTYLAMERKNSPGRKVRAVLAAFEFAPEILEANEILNLGIEMVPIPPKLRLAGFVPAVEVPAAEMPIIPAIPET